MFDPATLLQTGEVVENGLPVEAFQRMTQIEVGEDDFNKFAALALSRRPAASLYASTGGQLERSVRHREVRGPNGIHGDELRASLVSRSGTWGGITLLRADGPPFTPSDVGFLAAMSRQLADGLRQSLLIDATAENRPRTDAGLLVLADDNSIELANAAAWEWLEELGSGAATGASVPPVVHAVASHARSLAAGGDTGSAASARLRTRAGRWLLVRGSLLGEAPHQRAAVILEAAQPRSLFPLISRVYGLTEPERRVSELVAQGLPTREIAGRLHLTQYTVQDHLKSIFTKIGVHTRGELIARIYLHGGEPDQL